MEEEKEAAVLFLHALFLPGESFISAVLLWYPVYKTKSPQCVNNKAN